MHPLGLLLSGSQKTLLPIRIDLTADESETLKTLLPQLQELGFDIEEFGQNSFVANGAPADVPIGELPQVITDFITNYSENNKTVKDSVQEQIAQNLAKAASLYRNPNMTVEEMQHFVAQLLQNKSFTITPEGQIVTIIVEPDDLLKKFN